MSSLSQNQFNDYGSSDAIKQFQLTTDSISDKSSKDYGLAVSRNIWRYVISGMGGYFFSRNNRFLKNRNYANGRIDVQTMFQDRFYFNSKPNYIALNWQTLQLVNRIISGLVSRWMARGEKIVVKAIDNLSQKDKQDEYDQLAFILNNKRMLESIQQESGVQLIPDNQFVPEDKEELYLWQQQFQRLPEEILYEIGNNDVLSSNGWFDVLKEKMLHDSAEVGLVGTKITMDDDGVIYVGWVKPENAIYSFSEYPDFRDTTWRGEVPTLKISEIRKRFGKQFNPKNPLALTEEDIWNKIVPKAKEFQNYSNISWNDFWITSFLRPYDEWSVRGMEFEIKSVDNEPYTITNTKLSGKTYVQKGYSTTQSGKKRDKPLDNQEIITDTNWNIYRGVYIPDADLLVEWGLKTNMIRPQDPREIGNAEFSYSFYMPQSFQLRNLAIPEKIEAAVDGMILTLLKMQQVVARMRPTGAAIDESALQNIDYGLGEAKNKDIDVKKLFDQTGDIYYRGVDAEGNRVPIPIVELANSGFLAQMDGLIKNYQFYYGALTDELGEDPKLITQALQPRVTSGNVEASQQQSDFATDSFYRAYTECMKSTARKISCLLKDSVMYGKGAYNKILQKENVDNRQFTTDIRYLPTDQDVNNFQIMMNQAMISTPMLVAYIDPFQLIRIAKEDVKLAELLFRQGQKKMIVAQQQQADQNSKNNAQAQQDSIQAKAQADLQQAQAEAQMKSDLSEKESKNRLMEIITQGSFNVMAKGIDVQPEWKPVIQEIINNIALPLFDKNINNTAALGQSIQNLQSLQASQNSDASPVQDNNNIQQQPQPAAA
jgi:hypothetical protein